MKTEYLSNFAMILWKNDRNINLKISQKVGKGGPLSFFGEVPVPVPVPVPVKSSGSVPVPVPVKFWFRLHPDIYIYIRL